MGKTCVIIGASHAAAQLAPSLRQEGWEGEIIVVGDEPYLPYHRPPLSKALLSGEKNLEENFIRTPSAYEKQNIQFKLNTRVEKIDRNKKVLTLSNGEYLAYEKLVLCTGARVRKIPVPGADLDGIYYLRTYQDMESIRNRVVKNNQAIIIGGGYIGLETAAVLTKLGMRVTVIEMMDRVLQRVTAPEISEFYSRIHQEEGVTIVTGKTVDAIENISDSSNKNTSQTVNKVICKDGSEYEASLIIVGVGVIPNIELAQEAELSIENGIIVDEFGCTDDPDIMAAGDCTYHPNKLLGHSVRLESVPNATDQSRTVAASICGKQKPYQALPWFWSDQYDIKLQIAGLNTGFDEVVIRGDHTTGRDFVAWYLKAGKLIAADCINRPKEFMIAKQLLMRGVPVSVSQLTDDTIDPKALLGS